jgi:hypothetical protein
MSPARAPVIYLDITNDLRCNDFGGCEVKTMDSIGV